MKYTYAYKTSDGQRHEATMEAKCREDVFSALRAKGIKAIKVVAADGSKANGEVRGVRKRTVAALVALVAVAVGVVAFVEGTRTGADSAAIHGGRGDPGQQTAAPRHQIYGDPVIVEAFERGHFEPYLTNRLDQLLAWFAQPGKLMCPEGTDPRRVADTFAHELSVLGKSEKLSLIIITENDPREVRELKQIVNGLREEMAAYLENGNGTPRSYWRRLIQRTSQEAQIYERTRRELEHEKSDAVWEQKNDALRLLGLRTIPKSSDGE